MAQQQQPQMARAVLIRHLVLLPLQVVAVVADI
jgi:hypothetical protein